MNRRRLLKLGGVAAAGSLAIGSGAFTSVSAERSVNIAVTDDDDAYLSLDPDSEYIRATTASDELEFFIPGLNEPDDEDTPPTGEGVGRNSNYTFGSLVEVRNQGGDAVEVFSDAPSLPQEFDELALVDSDRSVLLNSEDRATELTPGEKFSAGLFMSVQDADLQEYTLSLTIKADPTTESSSDRPVTSPDG